MGHIEAARDVAIAKEDRRRATNKLPTLQEPIHWLFGAIVGFWLAWQQAVMVPNSSVMLASDAWAECQTTAHPTKCWVRDATGGADHPAFYSLIYSLDTLIPIVNLGQESAWTPNVDDGRPFGLIAQVYWWFHTLAGWVIASLLAVTLSGIFRRTH